LEPSDAALSSRAAVFKIKCYTNSPSQNRWQDGELQEPPRFEAAEHAAATAVTTVRCADLFGHEISIRIETTGEKTTTHFDNFDTTLYPALSCCQTAIRPDTHMGARWRVGQPALIDRRRGLRNAIQIRANKRRI
jgi:hypothetical protein